MTERSVRLAVDVDSGDYGAAVLVEGVLLARRRCDTPFVVYLCGKKDNIFKAFDTLGVHPDNEAFGIEDCPQKIGAGETPSRAWKNKGRSSIVRCVALQKEGRVDVSLSAGDTRILIGASIFLLGRTEGVARPALAAFLPTITRPFTLLLDVGANLNSRTEHLVAFGMMGYEYYRRVFGIRNPSVALLSIGSESSKGTRVIMEAAKELEDRCPGYSGFIEGSGILAGEADVVVCDGFVGNVLLKTCESFHVLAETLLSDGSELSQNQKDKMAILKSDNYGAAPLVGIRGAVFKAHGSSSAHAIANAIATAVVAAGHTVSAVRDNVLVKG